MVDETGDVKKDTGTVGVQRQYTGTAGRIENAQVAVYLVYAGRRGHAAVDRELYIPRSWTSDPDHCRAAGLGEETAFATKPELAARMVARSLDAGHRAAWVAGDEVYGGNPTLRTALEERGTGYVLAVACSHEVTTGAGRFRADALDNKVPKRARQKLSAGAGAKGHRFYDWAVVDLVDPRPGSRQWLIRRNRSTGELAYHRCYSPAPVPLTTLVRVAGSRWRVEEFFQSGKGLEVALDEHQVRRYPPWSRWVTLAMLAHAHRHHGRPEHRGAPVTHANATLNIEGRRRLVERCRTGPIAHVAAEAGVSRACLPKRKNRYDTHGEFGLQGRPSAPRSSPTQTPPDVVERNEQLRRDNKWSARRITLGLAGQGVQISERTVGRWLARLGFDHRRFLDPDG